MRLLVIGRNLHAIRIAQGTFGREACPFQVREFPGRARGDAGCPIVKTFGG